MKKTISSLVVFLTLSLSGVTVSATSQEISAFGSDALEVFLNELPGLTIKNPDNQEFAEYPASKAFAESLIQATKVSANCTYREKSLIEDCHIIVTEGQGGEGLGGATAVYSFTVRLGKITNSSVRLEKGL